MESNPDAKVNIHILNSLLLLHTNALRVEELDSYVLPLYEKYRIPHDIYTYQALSKMYLNMGDYELVKSLYKKQKKENFKPNQMYLNSVLEASMRTDDGNLIYDAMKNFVDIKR